MRPQTTALAGLLGLLCAAAEPSAQEGWKRPPDEVVEILEAPDAPEASLSPDARWLLLIERPAMPSLAELSRPWIPMAGFRLDPALCARRRVDFASGLVLHDLEEGSRRRVELPEGLRIAAIRWSHTSRHLAFSAAAEGGGELWVIDLPGAEARRIARGLCAAFGEGFQWMPDGLRLLCQMRPEGGGEAPPRPALPIGPAIRESAGAASPEPLGRDLLEDEHGAALLEHYGTSQLRLVHPVEGSRRPVGSPGLFALAEPSPDGRHLLVVRLHRPFSFLLPHERFPRSIEVWDLDGELELELARLPLAEGIPPDGVREGPRLARWTATEPAALVWVEALDGGDPGIEVEHRDSWLSWPAPFEGTPRELARLEHRARGIQWMGGPGGFITSELDADRHRVRSLAWTGPDSGGGAPRVLAERGEADLCGDPGSPITRPTGQGTRVVRRDGPWIYLTGRGDEPTGARPFLDRLNLETSAVERLWRSAPGSYESIVGLGRGGTERRPSFLTRYESPIEPPNFRLRDLDRNRVSQVTRFPEPAPALRGVRKRLLTYERADGVGLSAILYTPAGWEPGQHLPLIVWASSREHGDARAADRVAGSPFRYTRVRGAPYLLLLTRGFAVMDRTAMPFIGDPEGARGTFVEQLVASAEAAIDAAVELGVADRSRVGVGGHGHGAFLAASLLAHGDLFRAGVACSGAFDRTRTPFGFSFERRSLWEAPERYLELSPLLHADSIEAPLLLVHGSADGDPGTSPDQSERMFQALRGHGGTVRHVELPGEGHAFRARESVLHVAAEMIEWFDRHVKPAEAGGADGQGEGR